MDPVRGFGRFSESLAESRVVRKRASLGERHGKGRIGKIGEKGRKKEGQERQALTL